MSASESTEYLFVGGPADGRRIVTSGPSVFLYPILQPVTVARPKVVPFRRPGPSVDTATYTRFGRIYWWEGLIGDAHCDVDVAEEFMATGGPAIRRMIREEVRAALARLADGKGLGRIVWRVTYDRKRFRFTIRAFVGPRAGLFALEARQKRRSQEAPFG